MPTLTSSASLAVSADGAWLVSGLGTASGTDNGVVVGSVLTPTPTPAWAFPNFLAGRRIKIGNTWYPIESNTTDSVTITGAPGDGTYSWLLGGLPLAGDEVIIATGHAMTWGVADSTAYRLPASGKLLSLTIQGTGKLTLTYSGAVAYELSLQQLVTAGQAMGSFVTVGAATGSSLSINNDGGAMEFINSASHGIYHSGKGTLTCIGSLVTGLGHGMRQDSGGLISWYGNITGGSGMFAYGILLNASTGSVAVYDGQVMGGTAGPAISTVNSNPVTLTNVNIVDSITVMALQGVPPQIVTTSKVNYWGTPRVNADDRGSQAMRFYLSPRADEVLLTVLGGFEDRANPPGYSNSGTLDVNSYAPSEDDVRADTSYGLHYELMGNMTLPGVGWVIEGHPYGTDGTEFEGTYHEAQPEEVLVGVMYGVESSYAGAVILPSAGNIRWMVQFGYSALPTFGTLVSPAAGNVKAGVGYGAEYGNPGGPYEYTGTRIDCPVSQAIYKGYPYYGDSAAKVDGKQTLPNTGMGITIDLEITEDSSFLCNPAFLGRYVRGADVNGREAWYHPEIYQSFHPYIYRDTDGQWLFSTDGGLWGQEMVGGEYVDNPVGLYVALQGSPATYAYIFKHHDPDPTLVLTTGYYGDVNALTQGTATQGSASAAPRHGGALRGA